MPEAAAAYAMGHNERERRRLVLQASILQPFTEHLFRRAGITTGMEVLDVGCGVGDVSLLAARLTGCTGSVTSVDIDPAALQTLRDRAATEGLRNVECVEADIPRSNPVGAGTMRWWVGTFSSTQKTRCASSRPVANCCSRGESRRFRSTIFSARHRHTPPPRCGDGIFAIVNAFFARALHADMGSRLFHLFIEAGFGHPDCRGEFPVDGGVDSPYHEWLAEAVRSVLPHALAMNIPGAANIDIDTLESRLREEARSPSGLCGPAMFGCFARRR